MKLRAITSCWICLVVATAGAARAGSDRFELGLRGVLMAADGEPANDIPGFGLFGRYRLGERWSLGFAIDRAEYDFEQPARIAGIEQDPAVDPIDVVAESTTLSGWLERAFRHSGSPTVWFLGAGLGFASIDVPDAAGPRRDGGVFAIRTEVDPEIVVSLSGGVRRELGRRWLLEFALRADQHLAEWQLTDSVSGARASVDDYLALGAHFGFGLRF